MGRLIDADIIHPDVRTKRGGLAISQGQLAYAPTVEAITKDQYEARLKADLEAILVELQLEIEEKSWGKQLEGFEKAVDMVDVNMIINQKIDAFKGGKNNE